MANVDLHLRWLNEANNGVKQYSDTTNAAMTQISQLLQQHGGQWNKTGAAQQQAHATIQKHTKASGDVFSFFGKQLEVLGAQIAGAFALYKIEEFTRHAVLAYADVDRSTRHAQEIGQLNNQQMAGVRDSIDKISAQTGEKINDLIKDYTDYVARTRNESMKAGDIFAAVTQAAELLGATNEDMTSAISAAINNLNLDTGKAKEQLKQWEDILPKQGAAFAKAFPGMAADLQASGFNEAKSGTQIAAMLKALQGHFGSTQEAAEALAKILHKSLTDPNLELRRQEIKANHGGALELVQAEIDYTKQFADNPLQYRRMGYSKEEIVGSAVLREKMPEVIKTIDDAVKDLETSEQKMARETDDFKGSIDKLVAALSILRLELGKIVAPYVLPGIHAATAATQATTEYVQGKPLDPTASWQDALKYSLFGVPPFSIGLDAFRYLSKHQKAEPEPHQAGGIVTHPTVAMLGEAGPEAVIPLTELRQAAAALARSEEQQKSFKELSTMERIHQLALRTPQLAGLAGGYLDPWKESQHQPGATNWSGGDRQRMAKGGVSVGPTDATIGEAGPEMRVNLKDPSKSTLVTRRTDVTLGKDGAEAIVPLGGSSGGGGASGDAAGMPDNARAFISAIGSTETGFSYKEAYTDKYNQPSNNANVRKYGSVAADYGFYQMNRMDADEAVNKYGMDPMQARHLYGGVDQKSTVEDQTQAVNEYLKRRWPTQYQKMVDTGDFEGMRKTAQGTWFGLKDHQALARKEFQNPTLANKSAPAGGGQRTARMADGGLVLPLTSAGADIDKQFAGFATQEKYIAGREYAASLIESLAGLRNHSPADKEKIKAFMVAGGEGPAGHVLSAADEAWCAHTVRSAYRQAGLGGALGGTNASADSFFKWQQEVKPEDVQRGDVLTEWPTKDRSGHVGVGTAPYNPAARNIPFASGNTSTPGIGWEGSNLQQGQGGAAAVVNMPVGGPELGPNRLKTARRAVPRIDLHTPGPATSSILANPDEPSTGAAAQTQEAQAPIKVTPQAITSARRQTARIANNFQSHADAQHARTAHGNPGHV